MQDKKSSLITNIKAKAKEFINTFKTKEFKTSITIDLVTIALIIATILLANSLLNSSSELFVDLYENNPIDQILYGENLQDIDNLTKNIQLLMLKLVSLTILTLVTIIGLYSYSRNLLWNKINKKKQKTWKKWTLFIFPQLIILTLITVLLILIKTLILWVIQTIFNLYLESITFNIIDQILLVIILFILLHITIVSNYTFHKEKLIWKSIGDSYQHIKQTLSTLKSTATAALIYILLNTIFIGVLYNFITKNQILNITIQVIILAISVAYLRTKWYQDSKNTLSHHK